MEFPDPPQRFEHLRCPAAKAIADDVLFVNPILHIGAFDSASCPLQEKGSDAAVDSARHSNKDFFRIGHTAKLCGSKSPSRGALGLEIERRRTPCSASSH